MHMASSNNQGLLFFTLAVTSPWPRTLLGEYQAVHISLAKCSQVTTRLLLATVVRYGADSNIMGMAGSWLLGQKH